MKAKQSNNIFNFKSKFVAKFYGFQRLIFRQTDIIYNEQNKKIKKNLKFQFSCLFLYLSN